MKSNESAENYLETILVLSKKKPVVRSVDIDDEKNHITVTPEGYIYLTESGQKIADMIYERHEFLSSWLISLGVDPETATSDACRIEHVISPESFTAIKEHLSPGK